MKEMEEELRDSLREKEKEQKKTETKEEGLGEHDTTLKIILASPPIPLTAQSILSLFPPYLKQEIIPQQIIISSKISKKSSKRTVIIGFNTLDGAVKTLSWLSTKEGHENGMKGDWVGGKEPSVLTRSKGELEEVSPPPNFNLGGDEGILDQMRQFQRKKMEEEIIRKDMEEEQMEMSRTH